MIDEHFVKASASGCVRMYQAQPRARTVSNCLFTSATGSTGAYVLVVLHVSRACQVARHAANVAGKCA